MKIRHTPRRAMEPEGAQQYVITLSERNVRNLYHQLEMSLSGGEGRRAYGTLHKTFDNGHILVVSIQDDEAHYDEDGNAQWDD